MDSSSSSLIDVDDGAEQLADANAEQPSAIFWHRLLHRWFIEYNPLYLLSAALVLVGVNLISRNLAREGELYVELGLSAVAELYAWALIGGAALLTRLGFRRPAVMLALLTALYQCDLTLHTETCAYVSGIGLLASLAWFMSFVGKLYVLGRAVRLRLSPSALAVPVLGAAGLAIFPHYFGRIDASLLTTALGLWVFTLFAASLWSSREVSSLVELDAWGRTVLRRALRAAWIMWALLTLAHVCFWSSEYGLKLTVLLPVALLLYTRWIRGEFATWCAVSATLVFVARIMPNFFWVTALMAAVILGLRALRKPTYTDAVAHPSTAPYRTAATDSTDVPPLVAALPLVYFVREQRPALMRLGIGSIVCLYLSLWTLGWSGGAWPTHIASLDLLLTAIAILFVWKARTRFMLIPLVTTYFHLGVQLKRISAPRSTLQWGILSVGLGFGLLLFSLITSWLLRRQELRDRAH